MNIEELQAVASVAKDLTLTSFLAIALLQSERRRVMLSDWIRDTTSKLLEMIERELNEDRP